jgi:hypothetical protein
MKLAALSVVLAFAGPCADVVPNPSQDVDFDLEFQGSAANTGGGPCADNGVPFTDTATADIDEDVVVTDFTINSWTLASTATGAGSMGYLDYGLYALDATPIIVAGMEDCGTTTISVTDVATANVCLGNLVNVLNDDDGVRSALLDALNDDGAANVYGVGQCSGDFTVDWTATMSVTATVELD